MSTTTTPETLSGTYAIDATHSRVGVVARHAMVTKVRGSFNEFEGTGYFDALDPSRSKVEVRIRVASIDTRNADRDAHLRGNDFLDVERFPEITFVSTGVEPVGGSRYRLTGELTVKGVTRPVTFDVELSGAAVDPYGNQRVGLEGSATINRKDFGVNWNAVLEAGGVLVSEKVVLEFEVSAVKVQDTTPTNSAR